MGNYDERLARPLTYPFVCARVHVFSTLLPLQLAGIKNMTWHRLRHDAFSSLISMKFEKLVLMCCGCYLLNWLFFAFVWWSAYYAEPDCVVAFEGFLDALVMSISTANTIGYGVRAIRGGLGSDVGCLYSIFILSLQVRIAHTPQTTTLSPPHDFQRETFLFLW